MAAMSPEYELVPTVPSVVDYVRLRREAGMTPRRPDQAEAGLPHSWAAVHAVHRATRETVGMGRVLGDGGWYFHVADMAVLPAHQRRGIGRAVLETLIERIRTEAPPGAWVTLLADAPGVRLYENLGFTPTAPTSVGMALTL